MATPCSVLRLSQVKYADFLNFCEIPRGQAVSCQTALESAQAIRQVERLIDRQLTLVPFLRPAYTSWSVNVLLRGIFIHAMQHTRWRFVIIIRRRDINRRSFLHVTVDERRRRVINSRGCGTRCTRCTRSPVLCDRWPLRYVSLSDDVAVTWPEYKRYPAPRSIKSHCADAQCCNMRWMSWMCCWLIIGKIISLYNALIKD